VYGKIQEAAEAIRKRHSERPVIGLILGSGLGSYAESLSCRTEISWNEVPHFAGATVAGHGGKMVLGETGGVPVAALQGRVHYYEGHEMSRVVFPVRVLAALGIRQLIVTNAAGGINMAFSPGDLMLITDHLNLMGTNPLIGPSLEPLGPRFPDMSEAYDPGMRTMAVEAAEEIGLELEQGVYVGVSGPSYETPAEIRMYRLMGADAVGMSTVPEVIVANQMGIRVLGISCITNMAAGILNQKLSHQEVMDTTERVKEEFAALLRGAIPRMPGLL
jgi:purine-nucleoside phosphorylase